MGGTGFAVRVRGEVLVEVEAVLTLLGAGEVDARSHWCHGFSSSSTRSSFEHIFHCLSLLYQLTGTVHQAQRRLVWLHNPSRMRNNFM